MIVVGGGMVVNFIVVDDTIGFALVLVPVSVGFVVNFSVDDRMIPGVVDDWVGFLLGNRVVIGAKKKNSFFILLELCDIKNYSLYLPCCVVGFGIGFDAKVTCPVTSWVDEIVAFLTGAWDTIVDDIGRTDEDEDGINVDDCGSDGEDADGKTLGIKIHSGGLSVNSSVRYKKKKTIKFQFRLE